MKRLAILGAGGHARSVGSVVVGDLRWPVFSFFDLQPSQEFKGEQIFGLPVLPLTGDLVSTLKSHGIDAVVLAIGDNRARHQLFEKLNSQFQFPNVISPSASCKQELRLGIGNILLDHVYIGPLCEIGDNNLLNTRALVEHECRIGSSNHLAPTSTMLGRARMGDLNFLGAGAVVKQGVQIGHRALIGAQSFVLNSVEDGVFYGLPARQGKTP